MTSYTITIAPNDDSGTTTTLTVDTFDNQVRITDVHLHAAHGLAGGQMPTVDFGLLLRAVTPTPAALRLDTTPTDPPVDREPEALASRPAEADRPTAAATPAATPPAAPRTRRTATATATNTTVTSAAAKRQRPKQTPTPKSKTTPAKATTATATEQAKTAAGAGAGVGVGVGDRAYRRMPEDFATVYQQAGTATAIADHYQVPRHTANGWIRRIRTATDTAAAPAATS